MISVICGGRFYKISCFENMISTKTCEFKNIYVAVNFT
jgi:hypothetical protein